MGVTGGFGVALAKPLQRSIATLISFNGITKAECTELMVCGHPDNESI